MGRWNGPDYTQKRPERDSVPLIDCGHAWCSQPGYEAAPVTVHVSKVPHGFCSPGCASRWLIRYELRGGATTAVVEGPTPSQVRAWAREQGIQIGDRGRVPASLVQQYAEAH